MKKLIPIAVAAVMLAACGSSTSSSTTSAHKPAAFTSTAGLFYNMKILENDIRQIANGKVAGQGRITSILCIRTGAQTAECHATGSDGSASAVRVDISADGRSYITEGQ